MRKLQSENILLRAMEATDVKLMYDWENDISLWHLSGTVQPFSEYTLQEFVDMQGDIYTAKQLRLMIVAKENTIGCVDLFEFDAINRRAGIGILISEKERNNGYAFEVIELIINYSFNTLHLHQLYCNIIFDNEISLNLFKKHGFEICGCKKQWVKIGKVWKDEYILQLINNEKEF